MPNGAARGEEGERGKLHCSLLALADVTHRILTPPLPPLPCFLFPTPPRNPVGSKKPFQGSNCHEYEGRLYCDPHYRELLNAMCAQWYASPRRDVCLGKGGGVGFWSVG